MKLRKIYRRSRSHLVESEWKPRRAAEAAVGGSSECSNKEMSLDDQSRLLRRML